MFGVMNFSPTIKGRETKMVTTMGIVLISLGGMKGFEQGKLKIKHFFLWCKLKIILVIYYQVIFTH